MMARTGAALVGALLLATASPSVASAQWLAYPVPPRPAPDSATLALGRTVFGEHCWFCHGEEGDGQGPVAPYLWPRPRDFTMGSYKLRTTASGELPLDEDLYRSISLGLPGTAMPAWAGTLAEVELWAVVDYVKAFAADLFEDEAFDPYQAVVEIGEPPRSSLAELVEAGRQVYDTAKCWECHADSGRGGGERAPELTDDWAYPLWPANLRERWRFKGGSTVEDIYMRLATGLDGSPMPSYARTLGDAERWQVAYYTAALLEERHEARQGEAVIEGHAVQGPLPLDPADAAWELAPAQAIPLTGQGSFAPRWQIPTVRDVRVRVLFNADEVAIRLSWDDRFPDTLAADPERSLREGWAAADTWPVVYPEGERVRGLFPDQAEVLFPARGGGPALPHMVYGSAGRPVEVWRWSAEGRGGRPGPATVLRGAGAERPPEPAATGEAPVPQATAAWADGRWNAVFRQARTPGQGRWRGRGERVPVAVHVRDGGNGETGLRMSLSSWYFLHLREPAPLTAHLLVLAAVAGVALLEAAALRWTARRARAGELTAYGVPGDPFAPSDEVSRDRRSQS